MCILHILQWCEAGCFPSSLHELHGPLLKIKTCPFLHSQLVGTQPTSHEPPSCFALTSFCISLLFLETISSNLDWDTSEVNLFFAVIELPDLLSMHFFVSKGKSMVGSWIEFKLTDWLFGKREQFAEVRCASKFVGDLELVEDIVEVDWFDLPSKVPFCSLGSSFICLEHFH